VHEPAGPCTIYTAKGVGDYRVGLEAVKTDPALIPARLRDRTVGSVLSLGPGTLVFAVRGGTAKYKIGVIDWQGLIGGLMLVRPDANGLERRCWRALRDGHGTGSVVWRHVDGRSVESSRCRVG